MKLPKLADFAFRDKTVLLRLDLDIPLKDGKIEDDTRIKESLPTIKCLLDQQAKVILLGHLGRPQGKVVDEFKLSPVAEKLGSFLIFNYQFSIFK